MALRIISIVFIFLSAVSASSQLHAEESVKKLLFEDCDQARREFLSLTAETKLKTFDFLARVLALNTQAPSSPEAFALLPGPQSGAGPSGMHQGVDVIPGQLWQSADAKRELRAKRCALELFLSAGPSALTAIPRLISIYSEQPLSDEIAVALEETAANIAEVAHKSGMIPTETEIDNILPHTIGARPLLARNLVGEYSVVAIPRLVLFLASLSDSDAAAAQLLLRQLDPDATHSLRALLDLVGTIAADQVEVISRRIALPRRELLQPYMPDVLRVILSDSNKVALFPLLAKTCAHLGGLALDATQAEMLAKGVSLSEEPRLSFEEKRCLLKSSSLLAAQTGLELTAADERIVLEALSLLPFSIESLVGENRSTALRRVRVLASARNATTAPSAILQLALFQEKRSDSINQLLTVLSTATPADESPEISIGLQKAAYRALATLGLGKETKRFSKFFLRSIMSGNAFEEMQPLLKSDAGLEPSIAALLTNPAPEVVGRGLLALADRTALTTKTVAAILDVAKTGTHTDLVVSALVAAGPTASTQIRRGIAKSSNIKRIQGLSALTRLRLASKNETQELATLLGSSECAVLSSIADILIPLTDPAQMTGQPLESLRRKTFECVATIPSNPASLLIRARPEIFVNGCADLGPKIDESIFTPDVTSALVDLGVSRAECSVVAEHAVLHKSREVKKEALLKLLQQPSISNTVLNAVYEGPLTERNEPDLFYPAALIIAKHAQQRYTWKHFIREAISAAGRDEPTQPYLEVIRHLEPTIVLDEVLPALDSDDPERIAGACHIGASLGTQAIPIISKLWNLREKRNPLIRYAAAIALLEINPLTPELQDVLRQLLVNRYLERAKLRPIKWQQTVALVELPKAEFGTLRTTNLERLLVASAALK